MEGTLKSKFAHRESLVGTWVSVGHPVIVEVTAMSGFDFLLLDTEHTSMSLESVENAARAVDAVSSGTETVVRVPENDPVRIKRVLDIGVAGVMAPMIETAEEARSLVEATCYPPEGIRGIATGRATGYGRKFEEYVSEANDRILVIVQLETREGIRNAADIAAVEGVDALFVGPADLSGSLDVFAEWDAEELMTAITKAIEAGQEANVPVGTLAVREDNIKPRVEQGFDYLVVGKDTTTLLERNQELRQQYDDARSQNVNFPDGETS